MAILLSPSQTLHLQIPSTSLLLLISSEVSGFMLVVFVELLLLLRTHRRGVLVAFVMNIRRFESSDTFLEKQNQLILVDETSRFLRQGVREERRGEEREGGRRASEWEEEYGVGVNINAFAFHERLQVMHREALGIDSTTLLLFTCHFPSSQKTCHISL